MKTKFIALFLWCHHHYQLTKYLLFSILMPFYQRIDVIENGKAYWITPLYFFWNCGLLNILFPLFPWFQHYFIDHHKFLITLYHNKSYWKFITSSTLNELFDSKTILEKFVREYETIIPLRKNVLIHEINDLSELDKFYVFSKFGDDLPFKINSNLKEICRVTFPDTNLNSCEIQTFKFPRMIKMTHDLYELNLIDLYT